jgi:hypothetical protein
MRLLGRKNYDTNIFILVQGTNVVVFTKQTLMALNGGRVWNGVEILNATKNSAGVIVMYEVLKH